MNNEAFFIKANNVSFLNEARLTQQLSKVSPQKFLNILFYNEKNNSFITKESGITLCQELSDNYNQDLIINGVIDYIDIQQNVSNSFLQKIGIKDLSTINLFKNLEKEIDFFDKKEQKKIMQIKGKITNDIEKILKLGLKDSIEHGDFHLNNILLNKETNNIIFIDWVRANIANPFFSLFSLFYSLERRLDVKENELTKNLTNIYCNSFKKYWDMEDENIFEIYKISEKLYPLYFLITKLDLINLKQSDQLHTKINQTTNKLLNNYLN